MDVLLNIFLKASWHTNCQFGLNARLIWQFFLNKLHVQNIYNVTKFNWFTPEVIFLERFYFLDTKYIYILYTYNVYIINNNNNK